DKVAELFTRPSLEEKLRFRGQRHGSVNQGYFPLKETSDIHPDLVEGWVFCRRAFDLGENPSPAYCAADFWPVPELEPFFRRLCREHEKLIIPVMQSILMYLRCDQHSFDRKLTRTNFGLRLNYYPPVSSADDQSGAGRLLGHEDVDLFTIVPAPEIEGLQVLHRANMKWIRLTPPPGTIILNTGDYMQRITNDILPSTTHRVSKPRDPALRKRARVSFPLNVYLWEDEILEVLPGIPNPKYAPIKALPFHTRITSKYYGEDYAVECERASFDPSAPEVSQDAPAVEPQPFFSKVRNARELIEIGRRRSGQIADQWIAQHHRRGHLSLRRLGGPERAQCLPAP